MIIRTDATAQPRASRTRRRSLRQAEHRSSKLQGLSVTQAACAGAAARARATQAGSLPGRAAERVTQAASEPPPVLRVTARAGPSRSLRLALARRSRYRKVQSGPGHRGTAAVAGAGEPPQPRRPRCRSVSVWKLRPGLGRAGHRPARAGSETHSGWHRASEGHGWPTALRPGRARLPSRADTPAIAEPESRLWRRPRPAQPLAVAARGPVAPSRKRADPLSSSPSRPGCPGQGPGRGAAVRDGMAGSACPCGPGRGNPGRPHGGPGPSRPAATQARPSS